jgi:hypothetical protein
MADAKVPTSRTAGSPAPSSRAEIDRFLSRASQINPAAGGRLIFSLDATMSRQPTWDRAMQHQAAMFNAVGEAGKSAGRSLNVQLVYFRGAGECRASKWVINAKALRDLMTGIQCRGGQTQIAKVLAHAARESAKQKIDALIYIGDAMEENPDRLCHLAAEFGMRGTKAFLFQEGPDPLAERTFKEIARLTGGAWFRLGPQSAAQLAELLAAVAVYAAGGRPALEARRDRGSNLLIAGMAGK